MKYQEPINADGKTALYEACSSPFMTEQEIINLIDSVLRIWNRTTKSDRKILIKT